MGATTTIAFPVELPVVKRGEHWIARAQDRELKLSNLDKVYWPDEGYTKGDLLSYYFNISLTMLPHLVDRPLTLKRMPDGIKGDFFYEKNAPSYTPKWMPRIPVRSESENKTIQFLSVADVSHMLWLANLGCIEFHPLHGRGTNQRCPSYAFFDLDPFEPAGYNEVKHVANLVKLLLDKLGLESYPKTSGATGMQIMVPLDGTTDYDHVRGFVGAVSDLIHAADPETTTLEWEVKKRPGKVFLDVNMNREGANIAAAYSLRPEPGATASAPFEWDELVDIHPSRFTIETMFDRVAQVGDPFLPVAESPGQSLAEAIAAVEAKPRKARVIKR
ncbi:MAG: bifunctional non-ous end joining protein LigD [Actinomycetota bacterium]|nr:bifunctional non-ous end joining protein LigD [Actinomycetota bacterium]